jgi:hypothetical protein
LLLAARRVGFSARYQLDFRHVERASQRRNPVFLGWVLPCSQDQIVGRLTPTCSAKSVRLIPFCSRRRRNAAPTASSDPIAAFSVRPAEAYHYWQGARPASQKEKGAPRDAPF